MRVCQVDWFFFLKISDRLQVCCEMLHRAVLGWCSSTETSLFLLARLHLQHPSLALSKCKLTHKLNVDDLAA